VPKLSEKAERGKVEASRTETVTYVLEREGSYKLPEIAVLWWNPQAKKMSRALLPAIEINVEENPVYHAEVFSSSEETEKQPPDNPERRLLERVKASSHWAGALLGAFLLLLIGRRILATKGISIRSLAKEWRRRRNDAEITYFKRFQKASLSNDAGASLRELMSWLDSTNPRPVAPTLEQFTKESDVPGLRREGEALNAFLFARPSNEDAIDPRREWSGKPFYRLVAQARKAKIRRNRRLQPNVDQMKVLNPLRSESH